MDTALLGAIVALLSGIGALVVWAALKTREAMTRLEAVLDLLQIKLDLGAASNRRLEVSDKLGTESRARMEAATAVVANDLADAHQRADDTEGPHGAAGDAFSQSKPPEDTPPG